MLSAASPLFDALFMDIAASLAQGGLMVRLNARGIATPGALQQAAETHGATYLDLTPTVWRAALASGWVPPAGFTAVTGGEAMDPALAARITARGATLINSYGPTEATVVTIAGPVTPDDIAAGQIPIGTPLDGTGVRILDDRMVPVAPGVPGDLYLAGPQLAEGYLGAPAQTAAAFVADPRDPGARLYRTGDLAAWRPDGRILCLGRRDAQVKIRGMRVELGEIEAVLEAHPAIAAAAATLQDGVLVACVVPAGRTEDGSPDTYPDTYPDTPEQPGPDPLDPALAASLTDALAASLPAHMRPRAITGLAKLPLTPSGKCDRRALPILGTSLGATGTAPGTEPFEAPEGPLETLIARHIAELVAQETGAGDGAGDGAEGGATTGADPEPLSRHDSFFDRGGHSLMAVRLVARIADETGATLPLRTVFETPRIRDLAQTLDQTLAGARTTANLPPISKADRSKPLRLSYAQERLWFLDKLDPAASAAYRIDGALGLEGSLDTNAIARAFVAVVDRHESLRTVFPDDKLGGAHLQIAETAAKSGFVLEVVQAQDDIQVQVDAFLDQPYDLARGPLFRAMLVSVTPNSHVLAVGGHHAILDGWSVALLFREVAEHYQAYTEGRIVQAAPLPLQFGDYAAWQRSIFTEQILEGEAEWWRNRLIGAPDAIALPADRPRPDTMNYQGRSVRGHFSSADLAALKATLKDERATLFMGLEAALAAYLMRLGAGEDVVIGTAVAGRPVAEFEPMVGFFINTLALRNAVVPRQTFADQIRHAKEVALEAFEHQLLPFDAVIEAVRPMRSMRHAPVVQVMLILQNVPRAQQLFDLDGLQVDYFSDRMAEKGTQFDMAFEFAETENGLDGILTYSTALFDDDTAQRLLDGFLTFVDAAAHAPQSRLLNLPIMSEASQAMVADFNGSQNIAEAPLVSDLIESVDPAATAVVDDMGGQLSYGALDTLAARIATALQQAGASENAVVGLCLSRRVTLPAAMLACWKIGTAFVPINPNDPAERRAYMLDTARACLLVTDEETSEVAAACTVPSINLDGPSVLQGEGLVQSTKGALAYVLFTSGSTGRPKGVAVSHTALAHLRAAVLQDDPITTDDCLVSGFESTFDVFVRDVALTLASGAKLVLAQTRRLLQPGYFADLVDQHGGTWLQLTPTIWRVAMADGWRPAAHMRVEAGGEALDVQLAGMLGANGARVVNAYGPTEVTAVSVQGEVASQDITAGDSIPIGKPLSGLRAYVMDRYLQPVPPGVAGELVLAGPQVAEGYVGQPALTAQSFVADPVTGEGRAYRTGDLVRWRKDGRLDFLGRIDSQVKIRGMRIELGEIESTLTALPAIEAAAVVPQENAQGQTGLVAYLVKTADDTQATAASRAEAIGLEPEEARRIRAELTAVLPEHMIPQSFAAVSHLPLTPSGKIDRKALPTIDTALAQADYVPLEGPMETLVADQIGKVLGEASRDSTIPPDRIGRHDSFFALGGNSILAVQLINSLEAETALSIPLRVVFEASDIAELAARIDRLLDDEMPGAASEVDEAREDISLVDQLDPAPRGHAPDFKDTRCILLTGATGFLGGYLLRDILTRTSAHVICLVRADTADAARGRLLDTLAAIPGGRLADGVAARITAVPGELSKQDLGLAPEDRAHIVTNVDTIVHNGAEVHAMKPYSMLRSSNTLSVIDLLRMMSEGQPKHLVFVSTLGTLEVEIDALKDGFDPEVTTPADDSGYNLSKWAAERMLILAREMGYRSTIFRPGLVIGDSQTGYYQTSDIGHSYLRLFADTGAVPDAMSSFGLPWINVDRASEMILDIAQSGAPHGIAHVFDHGAMPSDVLAKALGVAVVPVKEWLAHAVGLLEAEPDHPSSWLLGRLRSQTADLEGVPDGFIPVQNAEIMFDRFAPPALPGLPEPSKRPTPEDGISPPIKWFKNRKSA